MKRPTSPAPSVAFGLIAWLEATRIALPLKGVECRFEVTGNLANVELDQIYHQSADRALDCTYTFPLPAGAAVYRCELHVNGRVIRAKVEEQQAAKRIFREQKAAGRRAALVETERENLFTLSLGNVQPDDVIVVRFAWFSVLDRAGDDLRLRVPTCPGVRYIPGNPLLRSSSGHGTVDDTDQVHDASRITPPRIDALHPDAAYFSIQGCLSAVEIDCSAISSPSHPIHIRETEKIATIALAGHAAVPDRDFVLAWRESKAIRLAPQSWLWTEGSTSYALVQLRAPVDVAVSENFEQDVYFLIDRSGSMAGAKWVRTCEALQAFVGLLGAGDRVWITLFESGFRDFSEAPMPAPMVLKDRGFQSLGSLGTGGGTELLPAATHALEQISRHSAERHVSVILITDGQVGNEAAILEVFRKSAHIRVHTFGIDTAVNDSFLKSLAREHRGGCWLQTPNDDIAGTISGLGDRLRRPVLTGLSVPGAWENGSSAIPDLHARETATISLRGEAAGPLEVAGLLPDGRDYRLTVDHPLAGNEAVKLLWARERIATLLDTGRQAEAIALARQYNLVCRGAAFIAWDEAEQVAIAEETLVQPALQLPMQVNPCAGQPTLRKWSRGIVFNDTDEFGASEMLERGGPPGRKYDDDSGFCLPEPAAEIPFEVTAARTKSQLLGAFHWFGLPPSTMATFMEWARKSAPDEKDEINRLAEINDVMASLRRQMPSPKLREALNARVRTVFANPPDAAVEWINKIRPVAARIDTLEAGFIRNGTPTALIDLLMEWVLASDDLIHERFKVLQHLCLSLDHPNLPAISRARLWRAFLEKHFGVDSEVFAIAAGWLPEIREPLPDEYTGASA